jgi:formylglycine-generating enzyme required for sulfatase activity
MAQRSRQTQASLLVRGLLDADMARVEENLRDVEGYRALADPLLREALDEAEASGHPGRRLRAALALLPVDDGQAEYLFGCLLDAAPAEVSVLVRALQGHAGGRLDRLWGVAERPPPGHEGRRLRAACALAAWDPDNPRWARVAGPVAARLVDENLVDLPHWIDGLRPVKDRLRGPLAEVFRDPSDARSAERAVATTVLEEYADRPEEFTDLVLDADARQFAVLWPRFAARGPDAVRLLTEELDRRAPDGDPERLARRQANAAAALVRLGQPARAWPVLRHSPDPRSRSYLVHRLAPLGVDARVVAGQLAAETDVSARRALILSLGEYTAEQLPPQERQPLVSRLLAVYRDDPDPGIHGAVDWLLRWGVEAKVPRPLDWQQAGALARIDADLAGLPSGGRHWYVNRHGQTLALLPPDDHPIEFLMGSAAGEPDRDESETPHRRRIGRRFAVATRDVTVRQFRAFEKAYPKLGHFFNPKESPDDDDPVIYATWYEAAAYCRWLSEQEGIPEDQMCYPPVEEVLRHQDGKTTLTLPAGYLSRTGYRLPTEAEWEYACRAGATTSRYYGQGPELLPRYAWYIRNCGERVWPVGQKKPNDFGLFDMHGNVWNWCQAPGGPYRVGADGRADDTEDARAIDGRLTLAIRGGAVTSQPSLVRSACRCSELRPFMRSNDTGLRLARTWR